MFKDTLQRKIFMPQRRKLYKKELHDLYTSPNIIRMIKSRTVRWVAHVTCMGEKRNAYSVSVGKPERKRPF
jgi:hypothetical protein